MSESTFKEIFAKNLRKYLELYGMSQVEFAKRMGVGTSSASNWINGIKMPRASKVDAMCELFHCTRSDFLKEDSPEMVDIQTQLIEKYLQQSKLRELLLFAGGVEPEEARDQVIDAVISALSALRKGGKT